MSWLNVSRQENGDVRIYSTPMTETLIVHWILAKVYSNAFVRDYITFYDGYEWAEKLSLDPRDFFNYAYLRGERDYFQMEEYKSLFLYYTQIRDLVGKIWYVRAKHLIFCEIPGISEFLATQAKKQRSDFTLLDSIYDEFQSYRLLFTDAMGYMVISKNSERLKAMEGKRINLRERYDREAHDSQRAMSKLGSELKEIIESKNFNK